MPCIARTAYTTTAAAIANNNSNSNSSDPDETWWKLLFALPKLVFGRTRDGMYPTRPQQLDRVRLLSMGRMLEMDTYTDMCSPRPANAPTAVATGAGTSSSAAQRASRAIAEGDLSKAAQHLFSDMLPIVIPDRSCPAFATLCDLHPNEPPLFPDNDPVTPAPSTAPAAAPAHTFSETDILWAIRNSSRASASGPSGWCITYLQHFVAHIADLRLPLLKSFTAAMRKLESGAGIPVHVRPLVFSATLLGLRKPSGGVRPVAMGDVLSRIVGKAIARHHKTVFAAFFPARHQLGVAVSSGAEAIAHATRLALCAHPDWVTLQLDFSNAFNSISRALIRAQLVQHFPVFLPYFDARYGRHTRLSVQAAPSDVFVLSRSGVQQGDPLGPFFFALGLSHVTAAVLPPPLPPFDPALPIVSAPVPAPDALVFPLFESILDDVTLCGPLDRVVEVANEFLSACNTATSGLHVNASKCVLWSPTISPEGRREHADAHLDPAWFPFQQLGPSTFPSCDQGIVLLGAPIGSDDFVHTKLSTIAQEQDQKAYARLPNLPTTMERILPSSATV